MKRIVGLLALTVILSCSLISSLLPSLVSLIPAPEEGSVACVVHYDSLAPGRSVGSACGLVWARNVDSLGVESCIWDSDSLGTVQIQCPAEGDTLSFVK